MRKIAGNRNYRKYAQEQTVVLIKVFAMEMVGTFAGNVQLVTDTSEIIGVKGFKGKTEEQLPLQKKYLDEVRAKYPNVRIVQTINPPLTPEQFGLPPA
jgi:hypothetical protein